ncbi:MAG TPA: glycosylase, partial [Rugosimonospora sp.]|nr:glycosylase [Rugosimonospora sp.]
RGFGNLGTCCGGTGLESHQKFQDSIYFRAVDNSTLYVNLYLPSTLNWHERRVVVHQSTAYPTDPRGETTLRIVGSARFALKLRVPYWVRAGFTVRVNGVRQPLAATAGEYVTVHRQWHTGDTVAITMPFTLRTERALDQPQTQALAYGPVPMVTLDPATSYRSYTLYPNLGLRGDLARVLAPGGSPMEFRSGADTVRPFYVADTSAYHVYFHRSEPGIVFGGADTGVPNVAGADGLTFLDVLWSAAPFAGQAQFRRAVRGTAAAFVRAGLLSGDQAHRVAGVADRVILGP